MIRVNQVAFRTVVRPMRTTFATSLGSKTAATSVIVKVLLSDGAVGWGEVPTSFVMPHETVPAIAAILAEARAALRDTPIADYPAVLAELRLQREAFHMTLAGLEVALFRADLSRRGRSELPHWGGRSRTIETDITIPFVPDAQMLRAWLDYVIPLGFTHYKVKVSGQVDADMAFLTAVHGHLRQALGEFVIRLDGNQGYTARSYQRMIKAIEKARIAVELFEQPLRKDDFAGLRRIRGCGNLPVILDETVFCAADCRRVIEENLGDGVNIKMAKSGIAESAAILATAIAAGLKLMIGCMTETMVGLSAALCLAAGSGRFDYIDLDSVHFLRHRNVIASPAGGRGSIAIRGCRYVIEDD